MVVDAEMPDRAAEEGRIRDVLTAFTEAWNKHHAHSFSMVFAEDS